MVAFVRADDVDWDVFRAPGQDEARSVRWKLLLSADHVASRGITTGLAQVGPGQVLPAHRHDQDETYYALEGVGLCKVDGVEHRLGAGDTLFIPGGATHSVRSDGGPPFRFLFSFATDMMSDVHYHFEHEPEPTAGGPEPAAAHRMETDPALNNPDATPGTGMLPEIGSSDPNMQPSS
jgi:quercetin dioxygenase-like cupin family protein